jgi:hypothetical protein
MYVNSLRICMGVGVIKVNKFVRSNSLQIPAVRKYVTFERDAMVFGPVYRPLVLWRGS